MSYMDRAVIEQIQKEIAEESEKWNNLTDVDTFRVIISVPAMLKSWAERLEKATKNRDVIRGGNAGISI